jgi:hypothetical protein
MLYYSLYHMLYYALYHMLYHTLFYPSLHIPLIDNTIWYYDWIIQLHHL